MLWTPHCYTKTEKLQIVSGQVIVCRYGRGSRWNTTCIVQKVGFYNIEIPNTWGDLSILIGIFGFYIQFLPIYELDIRLWRYILSKQPQPGKLSQKEEIELMQNLWNSEKQSLLEHLKKYIYQDLL